MAIATLNRVGIRDLYDQLNLTLRVGTTTLIAEGPGGCGKTQIVKKACVASGRPYFYVNAACRSPESVTGFVMPVGESMCGQVAPKWWFDLPENAIIHLDEVDKAAHRDQAAYLEIIDTRSIDGRPLPRGVQFVVTCNRSIDRGGSQGLNPLYGNRSRTVEFFPDPDEVLTYFTTVGVNYMIQAYLRENPGHINQYDPGKLINATSRSWMNCSDHLNALGDGANSRTIGITVASFVPDEMAQRLIIFAEMRDKLTPYEDIIKKGGKAKVPGDKSPDARGLQYLQISMAAARAAGQQTVADRNHHRFQVWQYSKNFAPEFVASVFPVMISGGIPQSLLGDDAAMAEIMEWKKKRDAILAI